MYTKLIMLAQRSPFRNSEYGFTECKMPEHFGVVISAILITIGVYLLIRLAISIFYLLTLQKALNRCAPENRKMSPGMVWLQLIPVFGEIWQFFNVLNISESLENEFRSRGIDELAPGKNLGLAMCICNVCGIIPNLGFLALIAGLVLWIMYWVKIADFSNRIALPYQSPNVV